MKTELVNKLRETFLEIKSGTVETDYFTVGREIRDEYSVEEVFEALSEIDDIRNIAVFPLHEELVEEDGNGENNGLIPYEDSISRAYLLKCLRFNIIFFDGLFNDKSEVVPPKEGSTTTLEYVTTIPGYEEKMMELFTNTEEDPFCNLEYISTDDIDSIRFTFPNIIAGNAIGNPREFLSKLRDYTNNLTDEQILAATGTDEDDIRFLLLNAALLWFDRDKEIYSILKDILKKFNREDSPDESEANDDEEEEEVQ